MGPKCIRAGGGNMAAAASGGAGSGFKTGEKGKAVVAVMQRIQRNMVAPPQKTDAIMIHGDFRQPLEIISQYEAKRQNKNVPFNVRLRSESEPGRFSCAVFPDRRPKAHRALSNALVCRCHNCFLTNLMQLLRGINTQAISGGNGMHGFALCAVSGRCSVWYQMMHEK